MEITTTQTGLVVQQHAHPLLARQVKDEKEDHVFEAIKAAIAISFAHLEAKALSEPKMNFLVNEVTDTIIEKYPGIRISEIKTAFANGIRGEYGEYFGLSVVTFDNFIKSYILSPERANLSKTIPALDGPTMPTSHEMFKTAKYNVLEAYRLFSENKSFDRIALAAYTFLDGIKLIKFSSSEKWDFVDQAKIETKRSLDAKKAIEIRPAERKKLLATLDELANNGCKDQIINVSKRITLTAYFQSIALEDSDLNQIMDDQKDIFMANLKMMMEERKDA